MAQNTIKDEFGEIHREVLTTPPYLSGICFHLMGAENQQLRLRMPLAWRRDLDFWLIEKAQQAGVQVWEDTEVTNITEYPQEFLFNLNRENKEAEARGGFIIGADGAASVVRKCLFPELKVQYVLGYRECYKIDLGLDKLYCHLFFTPEMAPYYFGLIQKGEFTLIELGTRAKEIEKLMNQIRHTLTKEFGFKLSGEPLWRDTCVEPVLYRELFSGSFLPARGNSLLVGDAAGLILPVSGEGIGTALKSGLLAAISVIEASENNIKADSLFVGKLKDL